jgi:hypothetical protein
MARAWVPARLVALLAGLLGTVAMAETRLQAFEAEIAQPLQPGRGKRTDLLPYPGKEVESSLKARYGNDSGYLMARLQRLDPDVASKIGRGKPYRSGWLGPGHQPGRLGSTARRTLPSPFLVSGHQAPELISKTPIG